MYPISSAKRLSSHDSNPEFNSERSNLMSLRDKSSIKDASSMSSVLLPDLSSKSPNSTKIKVGNPYEKDSISHAIHLLKHSKSMSKSSKNSQKIKLGRKSILDQM